MIWNDSMLVHACMFDSLVSPFDTACVNPGSINLKISSEIIDLMSGEPYTLAEGEVFTLLPGMAILASTVERVKIPATAAALLALRSGFARKGGDHALAGWIDPGFEGTITLELHAHRPLPITAGQQIVQMVVMNLVAPALKPYRGSYQHQTGPTPAKG